MKQQTVHENWTEKHNEHKNLRVVYNLLKIRNEEFLENKLVYIYVTVQADFECCKFLEETELRCMCA